MSYVDGFVVPVPKKNLQAYRRMAQKAGKIWREHGALENAQMLHEAGQRHVVRIRKFHYRQAALAQRRQDLSPRGIGKRGKHGVEVGVHILNHTV